MEATAAAYARNLRMIYRAFLSEGFSEEQAFELAKAVMTLAVKK